MSLKNTSPIVCLLQIISLRFRHCAWMFRHTRVISRLLYTSEKLGAVATENVGQTLILFCALSPFSDRAVSVCDCSFREQYNLRVDSPSLPLQRSLARILRPFRRILTRRRDVCGMKKNLENRERMAILQSKSTQRVLFERPKHTNIYLLNPDCLSKHLCSFNP